MPHIRITSTPAGEAPLHIREAWVGLVLPISVNAPGTPARIRAAGVLTGPQSTLSAIFWLLTRKYEIYEGYFVDTLTAIAVLEQANPQAAAWWRQETPHLLKPQSRLIFPVDCCQLETEGEPRSVDLQPSSSSEPIAKPDIR